MASNPNWFTATDALNFARLGQTTDYNNIMRANQQLQQQKFQTEQAAFNALDPNIAALARAGLVDQSNFLPYQQGQAARNVLNGYNGTDYMNPSERFALAQAFGNDPAKAQDFMRQVRVDAIATRLADPNMQETLFDMQNQYEKKAQELLRGETGQVNLLANYGVKSIDQLTDEQKQDFANRVSRTAIGGLMKENIGKLPSDVQQLIFDEYRRDPNSAMDLLYGGASRALDFYKSGLKYQTDMAQSESTNAYRQAMISNKEATLQNQQLQTQIQALNVSTGVRGQQFAEDKYRQEQQTKFADVLGPVSGYSRTGSPTQGAQAIMQASDADLAAYGASNGLTPAQLRSAALQVLQQPVPAMPSVTPASAPSRAPVAAPRAEAPAARAQSATLSPGAQAILERIKNLRSPNVRY